MSESPRRGPRARNGRRLAIALALALGAVGCGRKADPVGYDQVRPRTITSLTGAVQADGVHLQWQRTASYASGKRMDDLGGFLVFRGLPGRQAEQIADIPVSDRDRFRPEQKFRYVDKAAAKGETYYYRVISYTTDEYYSSPSNQVSLTVTP